jgi:hypothetical protein
VLALYTTVKLKSGERARIVETLKGGDYDYMAEIIGLDKKIRVEEIKQADILSLIVEVEQPLSKAI